MSTVSRPNFFLLLGLHPDMLWDQALFERKLREKRHEWSRLSGGIASKALSARQHLALIPLIEQIMGEEQTRRQEAASARTQLGHARQMAITRFEQQLAFLNARETVEQEEVHHFVNAFKHLFSETEIKSRLTARIVTSSPAFKTAPTLDASMAKGITDRLRFLHLPSLYALLQRPRSTATRELALAAERLYTRLVGLPPSATISAQLELAGLAREVFRSEERRARYDGSLRKDSLDQLLHDLDESMNRSASKELHPRQIQLFLEQARRAGWQDQEALEHLKEHTRLRKWYLVVPQLEVQITQLCCPYCEQLNERTQRYCHQCKQPLFIECPGCGQTCSCEVIVCGTCGFSVGNRYLVDSLIATIEKALQTGDVEQAQTLFHEAEQAWSSEGVDPRSRQLAAFKMSIQHMATRQQVVFQQAQSLKLTLEEDVSSSRHLVSIRWQSPGVGQVMIVRSHEELEQGNKTLPEKTLKTLGKVLEGDEHEAYDEWQDGMTIFYTPVILLDDRLFPGVSQSYTCIENVRDLTCQQFGSTLRLRWRWPANCQSVLVSYDRRAFPTHVVSEASTHTVLRSEYERQGYYDLFDLPLSNYYIVVSAVRESGSEQLVAPPRRLFVRWGSSTVILYKIKLAQLFSGKSCLQVTLDPPGPLPALLLISKRDGLPLSKTDGDVLKQIEATSRQIEALSIELPAKLFPPGTHARLFLADDALYHDYRVHHPSEEMLQLPAKRAIP